MPDVPAPAVTVRSGALRAFLAAPGPGIVYAGTAIGIPHLVQSTRAGASHGRALAASFMHPFTTFIGLAVAGVGYLAIRWLA